MAGFTWNESELNVALHGAQGPVVRLVERLTDRTREAATALCPKRSGRTSRSFRSEVKVEGDKVVGRVWSDDPVVEWLEKGTGIYGPRGQRIYPRRAKVLRWEDGGRVFFAPSIKGMRPQPFMRRALEIGTAGYGTVRDGR
ncbi:HK97 gp10 family phage protein [Streptomyces sp. NPDC101213]|uniref:HK97 gp10 family phage protein n=1 Tax=Streptomyces sp. NPDC101213 TaxID=3366130 RepID=UPI0037F38029